ncbi:MAG: RNA polymerase sigma factor [Planctomycetota bacterium]
MTGDADRRQLFEALVRDHATALHVFLRARIRDPGLADDVFQDTLVMAWRQLDRFDPQRSFGQWLRGIARNLVRQHHRKPVREQFLADDGLDQALELHLLRLQRLRVDVLDERLERLRQCIADLPATYKAAIEVRYRDGLRGESLALALQTSWDAVCKRLQRARALLLQCFDKHLPPLPEQS